jgi:OOP family OmpA-OmpF porin
MVGVAGACATTQPQYTPGSIDPDYWTPKVDQFALVGDGSLSMSDRHDKMRKLDVAQAVLDSMNQTIPELGYDGAFRAFGRGECGSSGKTVLVVPLQDYSTGAFDGAISNFDCAGGSSPLDKAMEGASTDLKEAATIPSAVVVVSDGLNMNQNEVEAAGKLAAAFGNNLAIYAVQVGDSKKGRSLLDQVVAKGNGGYVVNADELTEAAAMEKFVEDVFLYPDSDGDGVPDHLDKCPDTPRGVEVDAVGCPLDSYGDGVPDYLDKCPGTPKGVAVDASGCPLDSDGDGVVDAKDLCPNTPKGMKVDANGCPDTDGDGVPDNLDKCPNTPKGVVVDATGCQPEGFHLKGDILFDTNKWNLKPEGQALLDKAAAFLVQNPQKIEVQGYTDSTGSAKLNATLSQRRADSVRSYLVARGVPESSLLAMGYGPSNPIASNDTREGRAQNRRVELKMAP